MGAWLAKQWNKEGKIVHKYTSYWTFVLAKTTPGAIECIESIVFVQFFVHLRIIFWFPDDVIQLGQGNLAKSSDISRSHTTNRGASFSKIFIKPASGLGHGLLDRYVKFRVGHAPGMPGTFSPPPRVNDPDIHHGTCVTHVSCCMPVSFAVGVGENFPGTLGVCTTRNFTYLVRGPWMNNYI